MPRTVVAHRRGPGWSRIEAAILLQDLAPWRQPADPVTIERLRAAIEFEAEQARRLFDEAMQPVRRVA